MRNPKELFKNKPYIEGKQLGKAFLEDEVRKRLGLKRFFTDYEKFSCEACLMPASTERRAFNKYVKLLEYLDDRKKLLTIHKLELDRQIAWRVCFLNGVLGEAHRLLNEPIVITATMDTYNTAIREDDIHLIRKDKMVVSFSDRRIASAKKLNLTPLQEKQRELNGVALLVKGGKQLKLTDKIYDMPAFTTLEQLRTGKLAMPDPDFKDIQHRVDMIKGILLVFNIIGAEVGLDIPKAYGEIDIKSVFQNARGYNNLYGSTLDKLSKTGIRALYTNIQKYLKMINLDKEAKDKDIEVVKEAIHDLKEFDYNIGDGVGNRLENILFEG